MAAGLTGPQYESRDTRTYRGSSSSGTSGEISTTVVPPTADGEGGEVLGVTRVNVPAMCTKGAEDGDLMEIYYVGRLDSDGTVFDGSAVSINGKVTHSHPHSYSLACNGLRWLAGLRHTPCHTPMAYSSFLAWPLAHRGWWGGEEIRRYISCSANSLPDSSRQAGTLV